MYKTGSLQGDKDQQTQVARVHTDQSTELKIVATAGSHNFRVKLSFADTPREDDCIFFHPSHEGENSDDDCTLIVMFNPKNSLDPEAAQEC